MMTRNPITDRDPFEMITVEQLVPQDHLIR